MVKLLLLYTKHIKYHRGPERIRSNRLVTNVNHHAMAKNNSHRLISYLSSITILSDCFGKGPSFIDLVSFSGTVQIMEYQESVGFSPSLLSIPLACEEKGYQTNKTFIP